MYRHLQIQIGNQLNLSQNILEEITKSLESNSSNYMIKIYTDKSLITIYIHMKIVFIILMLKILEIC